MSKDLDADINALIERRAEQAYAQDQDRRLEEAWAASERRVRERERAENRAAWSSFYSHLAAAHLAISRDFQARALALDRGGGEG